MEQSGSISSNTLMFKGLIARKYGTKCKIARRTGAARKVKRTPSRKCNFASFNNTIITVTDQQGNTVCWSSAGSAGKALVAYAFCRPAGCRAGAQDCPGDGRAEVDMIVKGPGPGRDQQSGVQGMGIKVRSIADVTPVPHNGCRPPKKRRV